jgi:hypothetical protein
MWLPDNRSVLVFVIEIERGGSAYYKIDTISGETRIVRHFTSPPEAAAVFFPDGAALFYSTYNPDDPRNHRPRLMRLEIATGQESAIRQGNGSLLWMSPMTARSSRTLVQIDRRAQATLQLPGSMAVVLARSSAARNGSHRVPERFHGVRIRNYLLFVRIGGAADRVNAIWRVPSTAACPRPIKGNFDSRLD